MKKLALHWKIIIGLILGIIFAFVSSSLGWSKFVVDWIDPFGKIFINLLKLIAVPLVLFSIIKGISGLHDTAKLGRLASKTLAFYLVTTVTSVTVGLLLVNMLSPGTLVGEAQRIDNRIAYEIWAQETEIKVLDGKCYLCDDKYDARVEVVRGLMDSEEPNEKLMSKMQSAKKTKDSGPLQPLVDMVPSNIFFALNNNGLMLQVIFFAIFFGVTLISIPREMAQPVIGVIDGMNEVFLKMVDFVMQAAPFFVFALLAGVISKMAGDDPNAVIEIFKGLGWYSLVVVAGLGFMIFVFYPLLVQFSIKGMTYRRFFKAISPAQFLAFSTSSSAATLPVTMDCVRDNLGVSKETTSFVLPIGATVNMDGTSMYQAIAVVFLAQFHAVDLSITQQLMIVLTATLASIGSAAVPSAGLIMLIIVLESVGLNPAWVAIIFPVDRILDMCRTTVNVTGDCSVATIVADSEGQLDRTNWSNLD
ncbi:MAG: Na+/H+-dicarboxylate symporter [Bacteroidia bacterium]|jgi:Na+/H+-dicarboxylate symporter